jgi:hypothetical protein
MMAFNLEVEKPTTESLSKRIAGWGQSFVTFAS